MVFYEIDDIVLLVEGGLCSDPRKLDRVKLEFSATFPWLGEERNRNEGIEVFGRPEGVHHPAG